MSGRLDKNFRAGLREVERYIEADKAGALFTDEVSRLFRDEHMINPGPFAKLCKDHHVMIITEDQEFDFNATARDDYDDFIELAKEAYIESRTMQRRLNRRREKKRARGEYVGGLIPTGLMLDEMGDNYIPNPYWCDTVKWLTHRFSELDADLSTLHKEIIGVPLFCELPEDFDIKRIGGRIQLRKVEGGYTIAGRKSLIEMLVNPANIGQKVYNGRIVLDVSHPAIVDKEDYDFARSHLAAVDLEGNTIERPVRARRFTRGQQREGLLAGVREKNGKPVVVSPQGGVYIFQSGDTRLYTIKDNRALSANQHVGSISLEAVDSAVSQRLEEKLHDLMIEANSDYVERMAQGWEMLRTESSGDAIDEMIAVEQELHERPRAIIDHVASLRQQVVGNLQSLDKTITQIEKEIHFKQREYNAAKDVMSDADIREHYASLARLRSRLASLKEKRAQAAQVDQDIIIVMDRLTRARKEWETMTPEQHCSFIRLITENITLEALSGRWMKLTIEWSPVLAGENYIEFALLLKAMGGGLSWTPEEEAVPHRSWASIRWRARTKHIWRTVTLGKTTISDGLSLHDQAVCEEYNVDMKWIEDGCTEFWGAEETPLSANVDMSIVQEGISAQTY